MVILCNKAWLHKRASPNLLYCLLILSPLMAYLQSSVVESERGWTTAVVKPCHEGLVGARERWRGWKQTSCRSFRTDRSFLWDFCRWCCCCCCCWVFIVQTDIVVNLNQAPERKEEDKKKQINKSLLDVQPRADGMPTEPRGGDEFVPHQSQVHSVERKYALNLRDIRVLKCALMQLMLWACNTESSVERRAHMQRLAVQRYEGVVFFLHMQASVLLQSPGKSILFCHLQWCGPKHITRGRVAKLEEGIAKGCREGAPAVVSVMFWRPPSPSSCAEGVRKPRRLMGKEGYHQRMHLISIKMTLFPN